MTADLASVLAGSRLLPVLTVPSVASAGPLADALAAGGEVQMPFTKTFFSPGFGMVADRFGVSWMVIVAA